MRQAHPHTPIPEDTGHPARFFLVTILLFEGPTGHLRLAETWAPDSEEKRIGLRLLSVVIQASVFQHSYGPILPDT